MSPASPCTGVCRMDPHTGYCEGCFRTIHEITVWSVANDCMKRAILTNVDKRRSAPEPVAQGPQGDPAP